MLTRRRLYWLGSSWFCKRLADFRKLGPSQVWVIADEHPDSIGNGAFYQWPTAPSTGAAWAELPASYHQGGCTFVFGDGHTEFKKWLAPYTKQPITFIRRGPPLPMIQDRRDFDWLCSRMAELPD